MAGVIQELQDMRNRVDRISVLIGECGPLLDAIENQLVMDPELEEILTRLVTWWSSKQGE